MTRYTEHVLDELLAKLKPICEQQQDAYVLNEETIDLQLLADSLVTNMNNQRTDK